MSKFDDEVTSGVEPQQNNYVGAIYGSLLAASVVAGTSPLDGAPRLAELVALLFVTGLVFWVAHVYARVIGERVATGGRVTWAELRHVANHEWPLVEAAVAPCIAAAAVVLLGGSDVAAAWAALIAAICGQVGWAVIAVRRSGAGAAVIVVSACVNLLLGLVLVVLKAALTH